MSVLLNKTIKVITQGFTGSQGTLRGGHATSPLNIVQAVKG